MTKPGHFTASETSAQARPPVSRSASVAEPFDAYSGRLWILVAAAFVVLCAGIRAAAPILAPSILGAYVATVNMPFVAWLHQRRVPLPLTVAVVLLADAVLLLSFSALLIASSTRLSEHMPHYFRLLQSAVENLSARLGNMDFSAKLEDLLHPAETVRLFASLAGDVAGVVGNVVVALIIATFLLLRFGNSNSERVETSNLFTTERGRRTLAEVNRYIAVKTATSIATGLLIGIFTWLVGGELPVLFGVLAFLLNYIPSLGSFAAAIPAIGLGLLTGGVQHAMVLCVGYAAANLVIGNIVEPRVMGRALGLWPVVIVLSVMFWGWLLGITGALLSASLTAVLKMLLLATEDLRPFGLLLGPRRPAQSPEQELAPHDLLEETLPQNQDES